MRNLRNVLNKLVPNLFAFLLMQLLLIRERQRSGTIITDIITVYNLIWNSGLPNCLGLRIPVNTNLNISSWSKHLSSRF